MRCQVVLCFNYQLFKTFAIHQQFILKNTRDFKLEMNLAGICVSGVKANKSPGTDNYS
jgi:hypothetical protein